MFLSALILTVYTQYCVQNLFLRLQLAFSSDRSQSVCKIIITENQRQQDESVQRA
jgi:hypothetical protein